MRINRYLAMAGICSRRQAEEMVRGGRVQVNGVVLTDLSTKVSDADEVRVDGRPVTPGEPRAVYAYHKPVGITVTMKDPKQENVLGEYLHNIPERVVPVGRLDKDSSGLLLLTNDGSLVHRLTHPSFEKEKVYEVELDRNPLNQDIRRFAGGILLDGRRTKEAKVERRKNSLRITLYEGRNRQIRRMWAALGYRVIRLHRIEMDGIPLGNLKEGQFRKLSAREVQRLG